MTRRSPAHPDARRQQKRLATIMLRQAMRMSHFSNDQLRQLAADPSHRADMEQVLADSKAALAAARWSVARSMLAGETRRLERALSNPGIAA